MSWWTTQEPATKMAYLRSWIVSCDADIARLPKGNLTRETLERSVVEYRQELAELRRSNSATP